MSDGQLCKAHAKGGPRRAGVSIPHCTPLTQTTQPSEFEFESGRWLAARFLGEEILPPTSGVHAKVSQASESSDPMTDPGGSVQAAPLLGALCLAAGAALQELRIST